MFHLDRFSGKIKTMFLLSFMCPVVHLCAFEGSLFGNTFCFMLKDSPNENDDKNTLDTCSKIKNNFISTIIIFNENDYYKKNIFFYATMKAQAKDSNSFRLSSLMHKH